jgi:hypothetical protein
MAKYINPYTDFGFKKLFGEEGLKNKTYKEMEVAYKAYIEKKKIKLGANTSSPHKVSASRNEGRAKAKSRLVAGVDRFVPPSGASADKVLKAYRIYLKNKLNK